MEAVSSFVAPTRALARSPRLSSRPRARAVLAPSTRGGGGDSWRRPRRVSTVVAAERAAFPSNPDTYAGDDNLWVTQELSRALDALPRRRPCDGLVLTRGSWSATRPDSSTLRLNGRVEFHNATRGRFDMFVTEFRPRVTLLSKSGSVHDLKTRVRVVTRHPDDGPAPRPDDYWPAYIVPVGESTSAEIIVDIISFEGTREDDEEALRRLDAAWVKMEYVVYGHHGRTTQSQHAVLPLSFPEVEDAAPLDATTTLEENRADSVESRTERSAPRLRWREVKPGLSVLCIPTHLLCHLDDPVSVVRRYASRHARPGDVVTVGETPLAVMQGRTRHPSGVKPGMVAKLACKLFNRFSSVATACGMQCLVDLVGVLRVAAAAAAAAAARLFGAKGVFYRLAGAQANLIDDVSGQIPPYDQFITLGPVKVKETVEAVEARSGLPCAVVDVNDLSRIRGDFLVLGKSGGVDEDILRVALLGNPQGNGEEQTPIALIRHDPERRAEILAAAEEDERERRARAKRGVKYRQR